MTFLTAAQSAAIRLIGRKPTAIFSSSSTFELELSDLAKEVVGEIVKYSDWRALTKKFSAVGDGVTAGFNLPDDYDRMPKAQQVSRANWYTWGYVDAPNLNFWHDLINGLATPNPGYWIILGGKLQFAPSIPSGTTAEFYYISSSAVIGNDGQSKPAFTTDNDTFFLNERLITLGLIAKWRAMKRLDYGKDEDDYQQLLAKISSDDKGARVISPGTSRAFDLDRAYPGALGQ
ncbi:MAG: hypothetical protein DI604_31760 [Delftia acidovorans]|nr:MAG: hypothetical protein DI604_31760 [Delftia acidovorans]